MKQFEVVFRVLLIGSCLFFTTKFVRKATDTFTIGAISSKRSFNPSFVTHPLKKTEQEELEYALSQRYYYFGFGGQVYVFFSEDGKYVLKFFKQRLFRPNWLLNHLPLPRFLYRYRAKRNWKRRDKFLRDFFSYKSAFDELQKETALIYCHLNPSSDLKKTILLIDKIGVAHSLELDNFDFLLQKKAERVCEKIPRLIKTEKFDELKMAFYQILHLTNVCIQKGFYNRDPYLPNNCGLLEDRAIQIDVGRFVKRKEFENKEKQKEEFFRITQSFEKWLRSYFPQALPIYYEELHKILL